MQFFVLPVLAGKTHVGITLWAVVGWCCLLWKQVNKWLYLPHALMDFNQSWVTDTTWEPSFVDEVKGHISRSGCKIGWKCESGLIWKVEVGLEPNLVYRYWYNMGTVICSFGQRSYTKIKVHLRSSCKIGWKCENGLIWKVEVRFEPNLVCWYNTNVWNLCMFMWSKGHKSMSKVIWGQLVR